MTLVKAYLIKKSRRSSSEDVKEQSTIKILVLSLFPYPLYLLLLHVINRIIVGLIASVCNALFIYLIILVEFRVFYMIYVELCWFMLISDVLLCIIILLSGFILLFSRMGGN